MREAMLAAGFDGPLTSEHWQPHEAPQGSAPPSSLADAVLDPEEIVPGVVALRMDPLLLLRDSRVATPQDRDRLGIGPFICIAVAGDGQTSWAAVTKRDRPNRFAIDPKWRCGGNSRWRSAELFLLDTDELWIGPKAAFVTASWREALSDLNRAGLTLEGLKEVLQRVERDGIGHRHDSIPVDWGALARAYVSPTRISILELFGIDGGRILSPSELSLELQTPVENVSYYVTELAKAGFIVLVGTMAVRGSTEHFYRLPDSSPDSPLGDWEAVARAKVHPLRISILEILGIDGGRVLSPTDISLELKNPLSNTSYHITRLAKAGLVVLAETRGASGPVEHFYCLPGASGVDVDLPLATRAMSNGG
jgi:DNA-binding MarR family transcriptional regulator